MSGRRVTGHSVYDVIVVGVGAMGSAACHHLARRGMRVLGLERFDIPNTKGSSHGETRIIRLAYFEDPSYVRLLRRAYELWRDLEQDYGRQLLHITGGLDIGPPDGRIIPGSKRTCAEHGLAHEQLDAATLMRRFPGWSVPEHFEAVYQADGGFLLPDHCVIAHVRGALDAGADIRARERVVSWEAVGDGVRVKTDKGVYEGGRLVLSAGAWMRQLVPELATLAVPERQVLLWSRPLEAALYTPEAFPVWLLEEDDREWWYGFPQHDVPGVKLGWYHHLREHGDPEDLDGEPSPDDERLLRRFVETYLPQAAGPTMAMATCSFTNAPDEGFIVDHHPEHAQVILASPCSGHGFKFASVIGEVLADLATTGATRHDLELFRLSRFAGRPSTTASKA